VIVNIRQATADDLPRILALNAQLDGVDEPRLSLTQARALFEQFQHYPSYHLYVGCAPDRGEVCASVAVLVMHNLAHGGAPSAIVEDLVVARDHQKLGIGRQLMAHAMAQARAAGCYKLALSSNRKRKNAHAFYESLGFKPHGLSFVVDI
jgi:GNAT superfamily N-acetyltransferase